MSTVNEILASVSGNATLNDGKVTVSDAIELFNIAKVALIAASSVEVIRDTEDAAKIDKKC